MAQPKLKILQIIPADGWYVRYKDSETGNMFPVDNTDRVVCWALVDEFGLPEPNNRYVIGLVHDRDGGTIDPAEDSTNFWCYENIPDSV